MKIYQPRALIGALFAVICISVLFWHNPPYDISNNVYSETRPPERVARDVRFREVSDALGVSFHHGRLRQEKSDEPQVTAISVSSPNPAVSVIDINGDGFMDLFIPASPNLLFINDGGRGFHEAAKEYGIDSPETNSANSFGLFADFNGDGKLDLFLARWPCHKFYLGSGPGKQFTDHTELLNGYCSFPEAVGVLDFNQDGRLDLAFGNLLGKAGEWPPSFAVWFTAPKYDDKTGASSDLLTQAPNGHFRWRKTIGFANRPYTHALGVSDINGDGFPDLFVANDYSTDQMYVNLKGMAVRDVTQRWIPRQHHGLTGMSAEFGDIDGDGNMSLFVSNAYKPPFLRSHNLLWIKNGRQFVESSVERGVDRCGFAWGAKFADFNNDGHLDLAVANGRDRGTEVKKDGDGHSFWYERTVISLIPYFLRKYYSSERLRSYTDLYTSAFERDCLFMQDEDGHFYDVANEAGLGEDKQEGRGLALIDIDNDGRLDFVVVNFLGDLRLWHNESVSRGDWIGFSLLDKNGSPIPHGSKLRLVREEAPDLNVEYYPANGYRAQSDPRVHFGLGKKNKLKYLEVRWPDGSREEYSNLVLNQYQAIKQSKAR